MPPFKNSYFNTFNGKVNVLKPEKQKCYIIFICFCPAYYGTVTFCCKGCLKCEFLFVHKQISDPFKHDPPGFERNLFWLEGR